MDKKVQLRKHKNIATGLFFFMALLYSCMVVLQKYNASPWIGFVKAFAEAAMVGALADWFAVTALFRHPMGLKIPHTNLIEQSKNTIGDNLGAFVTDNFLTASTIRPYIERLNVAQYISSWIAKKSNQKFIATEITTIAQRILQTIDDSAITVVLSKKIQQGLTTLPLQNFASQAIEYAIDKKEEQRLIDLLLPKAVLYIEEHKDDIYQAVIKKKPLLGLVGGKAITNQLITGIQSFLLDIQQEPKHKLRNEITLHLVVLANEIRNNEDWQNKFSRLLGEYITPQRLEQYAQNIWSSSKENILSQLGDSSSVLNNYIEQSVQNMAKDFNNDFELQHKLNKWVQYSLYRLALRNSQEVALLIRNTVDKWDGRELSDKLELEVGKDLQFIRINGTLVGGLVGVIIHTITHLFL